jgi:hypothetical protein
MSSAARLVFTDAFLSSIPLHTMGMFLADGTHVEFDKHRCRFFWEGTGDKRKYHWVNWHEVCQPKYQGGLGNMNTKQMNIVMMVKWIWWLYTKNPGALAENH